MLSKKGQSALEYLMTYGWALVVIVIVIGALMLLIGSPSQSATGCSPVGGKFAFKAQQFTAPSDYNIALVNGTGDNLLGANYSVLADTGALASTDLDPWNAGIQQVFTFTGVSPNANNQVTLTITYSTAAGNATETKTCTVK